MGFAFYMLGVINVHPANSGPDMLLLLLKALISISAPILSNKTHKLSIEFFQSVWSMRKTSYTISSVVLKNILKSKYLYSWI